MGQSSTWRSSAGSEGNIGYDGSKEYESLVSGETFWVDWLGTPYSWIIPKLEWLPMDYYNYEDLNRVENNMEVVANLVGYFVILPTLTLITNRDMKHIDFAESWNRIEGFQNLLRQRFTPIGWLENKLDWKANDSFSFVDARRLELNLYLLYEHYKGRIDNIPICGALICGEEVI